jgi:N-acyl-D-aspartate/D-glutamate deacylase
MYDVLIKGGELVDGTGGPPRRADVGITNGRIAAIADRLDGAARETIDATGKIVTPGFIDGHTHYDGQVTWDTTVAPSSCHGVTTVVMGNCGVGFAPVHDGDHETLIELMEGVEDIPGTALAEGLTWNWTTFPDYLQELGSRQYAIDISAMITHGPLRLYVMRDRALRHEQATLDDIDAMSSLVAEALQAGAIGFSTSRVLEHQAVDGNNVPGTFAGEDELIAIAGAIRSAGRGIFQVVPCGSVGLKQESVGRIGGEMELLARMVASTRIPLIFSLFRNDNQPYGWRDALKTCETVAAEGGRIHAMVSPRPAGILSTWEGFHIFMRRPSYMKIAGLPLADRVERLRDPAVRAAILGETDVPPDGDTLNDTYHLYIRHQLAEQYVYGDHVNFEPRPDDQIGALAERAGQSLEECAYDAMMQKDGRALLIKASDPSAGGDHDDTLFMMEHENVLPGLSDAGAHVGLICDASIPTFFLMFWARDRVRGPRLPLERAVQMLTQFPANVFGFADRGTLEVGKRADINVIDFERLGLEHPYMAHDLPEGSKRLLQEASGYAATLVNGVVTRRDDRDTGARPGRLVRNAALHAAVRPARALGGVAELASA